ncbi:hypothetical protein DH2020_037774 [Rehmannia glutinosa]|uniref:Uncharacterized protein n=1 Tax=Rehmannia glutinosa TaxID=99300 RepID=A0ABR0V253_REHGL
MPGAMTKPAEPSRISALKAKEQCPCPADTSITRRSGRTSTLPTPRRSLEFAASPPRNSEEDEFDNDILKSLRVGYLSVLE